MIDKDIEVRGGAPRQMSAPFDIRPMIESDVPAVRSLVIRTIRTSYHGVYSPAAIDFFLRYHELDDIRRDLPGVCLIALADGKLVGTAALVDGEIRRVFVEPSFQGRGIGRKLVATLIERARADGVPRLRLDASLVSRRMYRRMGFVLVAERVHDLGGGEVLPYHEMVLDL